VNYAVDRFVNVVDYQGDKKHNGVACHDINITVVYCNVDRLAVVATELSNSLGNISKVARR